MKIAVCNAPHEIADTVCQSLVKCFGHDPSADVAIGYGILRGVAENLRSYKHWFEVDRGYFNPGHYDGYYRISYKGTQAKWHNGIPRKLYEGTLEPWRGLDPSKPVLVCPPTDHVMSFFGLTAWPYTLIANHIVRNKGDTSPVNFLDYNYVLTFNSSMGWKALQAGVPCISDRQHSIVGSYYHSLTDNSLNMVDSRLELFEAMQAHQFTLKEIREGKAWPIIEHYLSGSGLTQEKPSPPMSADIPSENGLIRHFQSNT